MRARNAPDSAPWMMRWSYVDVIVITFETPSSARTSGSVAEYSAG